MMNFKYEVTTYMDGEEVIFRTNNPRNAITAFFDAVESDAHVNIVDGTTGEVLAIANCPDMDNYVTEEMSMMMLGWLIEHEWGEPVEEPAPEVERVPTIAEVMVALASQMANELGVEIVPQLPAGE